MIHSMHSWVNLLVPIPLSSAFDPSLSSDGHGLSCWNCFTKILNLTFLLLQGSWLFTNYKCRIKRRKIKSLPHWGP